MQKSADGSNWLPDVLDAEGLVFPLTSREIVEAAKNIRWYLETVLLYEIYPSRILQTKEEKNNWRQTASDKFILWSQSLLFNGNWLLKEFQPKFAEREDFLKKI